MSYTIKDFNNLPSVKAKAGKTNYSAGYQQNNPQYQRRQLNFLKISPGESCIIRPVGKTEAFFRFWYEPAHKYIIADVKVDDSGEIISSNIDELQELLKSKPQHRFAMNVIDRSDQKIKIWSGPISVMEEFGAIAKIKGIKMGGKNGGDWKVSAEKISTGKAEYTSYKCEFLKTVPFTEEELSRIQNPDKAKNEWYILEKIYRPTSMEYVHKLMGQPVPGHSEEVTTSSSVDDDIEF